ncbi:MAG: cytochrome c maturation protein CcmE [Ferruginibacter sp.]
MKRTHIIILVAIAVGVVGLFVLMGKDFATYDSIDSARNKQGRFVHLMAKVEAGSLQYNPEKDPNYLSFYAIDSLGGRIQVIYHNSKPSEMEKSERIVMQGSMQGNVFQCKSISLKCPSKYKDDKKMLEKSVTDN